MPEEWAGLGVVAARPRDRDIRVVVRRPCGHVSNSAAFASCLATSRRGTSWSGRTVGAHRQRPNPARPPSVCRPVPQSARGFGGQRARGSGRALAIGRPGRPAGGSSSPCPPRTGRRRAGCCSLEVWRAVDAPPDRTRQTRVADCDGGRRFTHLDQGRVAHGCGPDVGRPVGRGVPPWPRPLDRDGPTPLLSRSRAYRSSTPWLRVGLTTRPARRVSDLGQGCIGRRVNQPGEEARGPRLGRLLFGG